MDARGDGYGAERLDCRVPWRHASNTVEGAAVLSQLQSLASVGQDISAGGDNGHRQRHQPPEQADDGLTGLVAAAMWGSDEDDRRDEGQRMDEQRLPQQRLGLRLQVQLIQWPVADRVPKLRPGLDGDQL